MLKHLILMRHPATLEDRRFLQAASKLTRLSSLMVHGRTVLTDEQLRTAVAELPHLNRILLFHCFKV